MDSRICTGLPVMVTGAVHGLGYYIGPFVKSHVSSRRTA